MTLRTGLLIGKSSKNIGNTLKQSFQNETLGTLYIKFLSENKSDILTNQSQPNQSTLTNSKVFKQTVIDCYRSLQNLELDVRVLLSNFRDPEWLKVITSRPIEIVYFDSSFTSSVIDAFVLNHVTNKSENCQVIPFATVDHEYVETKEHVKNYDSVVLGGTFDKIHCGHKILFSEAILRCQERLTVGVTSDEMLQSKLLCELIDDCPTRIKKVQEFLQDVDPGIDYEVIEINDMYGPTKTDSTFQMIVVTSETRKGGDKINEYRKNVGLKPLDIVEIDVIDCCKESDYEEKKISSSNYRMRMLGKLLKPPALRSHLPKKPYIIGLTGGIASGKTAISNYLKEFGCEFLNCDELGHRMYDVGSSGYDFVKDTFGLKVLNDDGSVNRQQLASIVFSNREQLTRLNHGLWPLILDKVRNIISTNYQDKEVVVIEAALLIQANWSTQCHEIWSCIIPAVEAVKRLQRRSNLSTAEAEKRINSQPKNKEYVANANVIFCTFWDPDYTRKQVEKAWLGLKERLHLET